MTLADASEKTKEIFKWGAILLGAIFLLLIVFRVFSYLKSTFSPPPPPQVSFGKFTSNNLSTNLVNRQLSYTIDTITGTLPKFPSQLKVFKTQEFPPDLLALSKTQEKVKSLGFNQIPLKISENIYQWRDQTRILTININDLNLNMTSDFLTGSNQSLFNADLQIAQTRAENFLNILGLLTDDLDLTKTNTSIFSVKNYNLIPATSLSNTTVVELNFFQKDLDSLPVYYPQVSVSPINILVGRVNGSPEVVQANFFHQKPSDVFSTYPIKTANQAFDDLKKGNAYVASFTRQSDKILIKNVYLGYFISEKKQQYILPIIVFLGDNGFVAYVSAITDEWVGK